MKNGMNRKWRRQLEKDIRAELRADLKSLTEQRNEKWEKMDGILNAAKGEARALTEEEQASFDSLEKEINAIDITIKAEERARKLKNIARVNDNGDGKGATPEERAFENYIRGTAGESRADVNLEKGDNGAVIPQSIAAKIIKRLHDISPVYQLADRYPLKGTLSIPYYDSDKQDIRMEYATEFTNLESTAGKFGNIELKGFLAGALSKISKSLANNSHFNLTAFTIEAIAEAAQRWIEREMLLGTEGKIQGLREVKQIITAAKAEAVTADELIDLQEEVPDTYQGPAIWIMNKKTRTAIRKLKDNDGNYLLNKDVSSRWGYTLLGKDVYCSDSMPKMEAGKTSIYYGDMSGLALQVSEEMNVEVLRELFATQHAIGVVCWMEVDSKVENAQKLAALKMAGTAPAQDADKT